MRKICKDFGFYGNIEKKDDDEMEIINLDTNAPETQMQRTKRLGLKQLDSEKVFENDKGDKSGAVPRVLVRRSKLNVYIPQAGADRESISSAKSSRNIIVIYMYKDNPS